MTRSGKFCVLLTLTCLFNVDEAILVRKSLEDAPDAVCLDGTPALFYHSPIDGSRRDKPVTKFVIYLNGGGYCHDIQSCHLRCYLAPQLCTTPTDPVRYQYGILSDQPDVNPALHDYYKVDIPYCSGDMYVGRQLDGDLTEGFKFGGKHIMQATVNILKKMAFIDMADEVILSGSSAGGAGVAFNCDSLKAELPDVNVRCVVDAAFFYPVLSPLSNESTCETIVDILEMGSRLWSAPEIARLPLRGWWRNIRQPLFISSAKYDEFGFDIFCGDRRNIGNLTTWGLGVTKMVAEIRRDDPTIGLYMPGCFSHVMLNDDYMYNQLPVGESRLTLAESLRTWLTDTQTPTHTVDKCPSDTTCNLNCKSNY